MRRFLIITPIMAIALLAGAGERTTATGNVVRLQPAVKYVAQSSPTFSVNVLAENVATPEMHVRYDKSNVDTELALGTTEVRATYSQTNVDTGLTVGATATAERRAQGFRVTQGSPVNRVLLWVKKVGTPADGLRVELQGDSGGLPNEVVLSTGMPVGAANIGTSYAWAAFDLDSPPTLSPGTQYHVVLKRTLEVDAAKYYVWGADTSSPGYTNGAAGVYNGSTATWSAAAPPTGADHAFVVDTTPKARAQGFRVPTTSPVNRVLLWPKRVGDLTGDDGFLTVEIRGDSGGVPGDLLAASSPMQVSVLKTYYDIASFSFISPPNLSAGTQYHLVLKWTDIPDAPNYVVWGADTSSPGYTDGAAKAYYGGSTWVAATPEADHAFEVAYACPLNPNDPGGPTGPCGLGGFQIQITFLTSQFAYDNIVAGTFLTSTGRSQLYCYHPSGDDPSHGVVAYSCSSTSGATPLGPHQGSGVLATATFTALGSGGPLNLANTILMDIEGTPLTHSTQGNQVIVANLGTGDTDGDGCADIEEAGDNPALGGDRNPYNAYDFFDVPRPVGAPGTGTRDKQVDGNDALAVLSKFGASPGDPNPTAPKYDPAYDRSSPSPEPWSTNAPNGVQDGNDVLWNLTQFGHSCFAPP